VPESIKQKALRKLWVSDPVFTTPDPFQDYLGDYTDAAVAVPAGTLKTAYRVGKGFLSDEEVAEWEALGKPAEKKVAGAPADPSLPILQAESPDQPDVQALLRQADAYLSGLYPARSNHLLDGEALGKDGATFLVARLHGAAVGCGAVLIGDSGDEAEIKRMFVLPELRRRSIGGQLLAALEAAAKARGVRVIRLESGTRQPEARGLYARYGYAERGPFGRYTADPLSIFMEKWIG
jgi:putative acetyltransferase